MQFLGTCSVQCFRPSSQNLSLTPRTPCLLQPLTSPATPHSDVLTAVSRLTMHLQYVSSYHNVRGGHCVPDTHALDTTTLRLRGTVSDRGVLLRPLTPQRVIHFCTTQTTAWCLSRTHLPKMCSALFAIWRFVAVFKRADN